MRRTWPSGGAATTAAAALRFVLSNPAVGCACSGMNTLEQLRQNVATVEALDPLSPPEWSQVNTILDQFHNLQRQFCTACGYCMPCPHGVDIPENFRIYNHDQVYGLRDWARQQYARLDPAKQASACTECGECEPKCPNQIPIRKQLQMVRDRFAGPPSEVA